jgi:8-amino-7-oxononanoate synthase
MEDANGEPPVSGRSGDVFRKCYEWQEAKQVMAAGLYPYFTPITGEQGAEVTIQGRRFIMLGSNNYLGLTNDPRVKEVARDAIRVYGVGCTGSRLLNGTLDIHLKLEEELARFMDKPAAIAFATGFQTNLGAISSLVGRYDVVISDRRNHASIFDGCRLAFGKTIKYNHDDMDDLARVLRGVPPDTGKLVVTDGVFSMEGTIAKLKEAVALSREHGARLMVDEAHGVGVLGEKGRGACEHLGVLKETDLIMGTFSKSLASIGGFLAGEEDVIFWIKHQARAMVFSAALPPAASATVLKCLEIIRTEPERRVQLMANAKRMKEGLAGLGYDVGNTETPVVPVVVGDDGVCFQLWKSLFERGVFTNPVVSPATPPGRALLRVSCMATHTPVVLDRALESFREAGREAGVLPA